MKQALLISLLVNYLAGCSDVVKETYSTLAEAKANGLFERGWLPKIIPPSSKEIELKNELDLNQSEGEFYFSISELREFTEKMKKEKENSSSNYLVYTYTKGASHWTFKIDEGTGHTNFYLQTK